MPAFYSIDRDLKLIEITCEGTLTDSDLQTLQQAVLNDAAFSTDYDRLVDVTPVTEFNASVLGIAQIAHGIQADSRVRYAIVAERDAAFGLARMYGFFAEGASSVEVFRSMAEARSWLESGRAPGGSGADAPVERR